MEKSPSSGSLSRDSASASAPSTLRSKPRVEYSGSSTSTTYTSSSTAGLSPSASVVVTSTPEGTVARLRDEASICSALGRLIGPDKELCDFTFIVGEERELLPAVRAIVAVRSPPLRAMLFGGQFQTVTAELEQLQWTPNAFRRMLEFMHSGTTEVDATSALEVMQLADYFQVDDLKSCCKGFLAENLTPETATTLLAEAAHFNDEQLRAKCKEYFMVNAKYAFESPAFGALPESLLIELLSDDKLNVDEWSVYQAVKSWMEAQPKQRQRQGTFPLGGAGDSALADAQGEASSSTPVGAVSGPLQCVRLGQLCNDELREVRKDGLVSKDAMLDALFNKLDGHEPTDGRRRTVCLFFRFDTTLKGEGVRLDEDGKVATFAKDNCVLGDQVVPGCGQVYWEVIVSSGTNAYVGIARKERIDVHRNMGSGGGIAFRGIGGNEKWKECSHFEYGRRIGRGDVVGVLVDLPARSISFYLNGEALGVAFDNLDNSKQYWPCFSNNAGEMRLTQSPKLPP